MFLLGVVESGECLVKSALEVGGKGDSQEERQLQVYFSDGQRVCLLEEGDQRLLGVDDLV